MGKLRIYDLILPIRGERYYGNLIWSIGRCESSGTTEDRKAEIILEPDNCLGNITSRSRVNPTKY